MSLITSAYASSIINEHENPTTIPTKFFQGEISTIKRTSNTHYNFFSPLFLTISITMFY
jgi:hypothetical protein